jgi:hypothetical protein
MKKTFLLLLLILLLMAAKAQQTDSSHDGFHFAGGINMALPLGEFSDSYSFGIGLELQPEYRLPGIVSIYGSVGYTNFFAKNIETLNVKDIGMVPILAGGKVYLSPQFFIGAKFGVGLLTGGADGSSFDYQPQFGFNGKRFLLNFSYNGLSKNNVTLSSFFLSWLYKFK